MNIDYVARNFSLDEQVRSYTEGKLPKVTKFLDEPVEIRVIMERTKHQFSVDLHIAHRFGVIQATEETNEIRDAVNLAVDKAEKQARRAKKKHKDKRRRADHRINGHQWPVEVLSRESIRGGESPKIVKSSTLDIKPMRLDEAALVLESSKNEFLVFRDADSDQVSVLYKRRDDNYGLITPD